MKDDRIYSSTVFYVNGTAATKPQYAETNTRRIPAEADPYIERSQRQRQQRQQRQQQQQQQQQRSKPLPLPQINLKARIVAVMSVCVVAICLMAIIAGYAVINAEYNKLNAVNNSIADRQNNITSLEVELETKISSISHNSVPSDTLP